MTNFDLVTQMNEAFGNPKGNPHDLDEDRVRNQVLNIADELGETFIALGASKAEIITAVKALKAAAQVNTTPVNLTNVRDGLCDINVFSYGAHHLMGINADADMRAVLEGVMTRFVKNPDDLEDSIAKHKAKGVTNFTTEGSYPNMILRSGKDQPDAPKGKFLKSASYKETVFPPI